MAVTDLTGTTWLFNDILAISGADVVLINNVSDISFLSNSVTYNAIALSSTKDSGYDMKYGSTKVYNTTTGWVSNAYKTVEFTGTTTNSDFKSWLEANATDITPKIYSKVVFGGQTVIDLTSDTATESTVLSGYTFHKADGTKVTGTMSGSSSMSDPIRFFDYDGTLVASYTSVPSALPDNPTHTGLVAQGWNYTLAQIETQFNAMGSCDIGQMYITESGDTEIDIVLNEGRLEPYLRLAPNGTVEVDWGDGTSKSTVTGTSISTGINTMHSYASAGAYTIKIHVVSGSFTFDSTPSAYTLLNKNASSTNLNRAYANTVRSIRLGTGITRIGYYGVFNCTSLTSISVPSSVTSFSANAFFNCYSLVSFTIPNTFVWSTGSGAFTNCYSLASVSIPSNVTNIGGSTFYYCQSLASISIPSSVTKIDSFAFGNCTSLTSISVPSSVTAIEAQAFQNCYSLTSISIPSNATKINGTYDFQNCYSLASISIPSSVKKIGNNDFQNCYSLASISIPSNVTTVGTNAFNGCYGLGEIHFLRTTPPTVSNSNTFTNVPTDCKIYVPSGSLSAYTSASNYPSSSTYTYIEE